MKLSKLALAACASLATLAAVETASAKMQHVLLISVDGMHAVDLQRFVAANPNSTLAKLSKTGVTYTEARTPMPSDSFPGVLALVTGGHPGSTGVWYDDAFARDLADPKDCKKLGTGVVYDEAIDAEEDKVDTTIDTKKLVLDPTHNCAPVFPHSLLRVNTVFEVAKAAKGTTAWADKHPSYDLLQGPSGSGITDLYTPEIAVGKTADTVEAVIAYEKVKVDAILNQIKGKDHTGTKEQAVPMIFGMNFQAVSVGQKIPSGGYKDAEATPSAALEVGLKSVDAALGQMTAALEAQKLDKDTLVIVTAKHGQSPIDPKLRKIVDKKAFGKVLGDMVDYATYDSTALLWLKSGVKVEDAVAKLKEKSGELEIETIFHGKELADLAHAKAGDIRMPEIMVQPKPGTIYAKANASKIAEHGGASEFDRHVALLVSNPALKAEEIKEKVTTTWVAPTILKSLGLDPNALDAVKAENTPVLPGLKAVE